MLRMYFVQHWFHLADEAPDAMDRTNQKVR
jgi:hypothetical protein